MSWFDDAACLVSGKPDAWFPAGRSNSQHRADDTCFAISVCIKCPVRAQCAAHALNARKTIGIWAGVDLGDDASTRRSREDKVDRLREIAKGASA